LVHSKVDGEDLVDAPIGHGRTDQYRAAADTVAPFACPLHGCAQLAACGAARTLDTPPDQASSLARGQAIGRVVRVLRPWRVRVLDQFHAASIKDLEIVSGFAENDESGPPGMGSQTKGNVWDG
jgi:hypothetical protein